MKKKINNWIAELDSNTAKIREAFGHLSPEILNTKPDANNWSIGQVIEHLLLSTESYYPAFEQLRNGTYNVPFIGKIGFINNLFGNMIQKAVKPTTKTKTKTFPIWQPQQSSVPADIVEKFVASQEVLKAFIKDSAPLLEKKAVISSPANKNLTYKLEKCFDIIIDHQKRHYDQAKRVLEEVSSR